MGCSMSRGFDCSRGNPSSRDFHEGLIQLDTNELEALEDGGLTSAAGAHERVEYDSSRRGYQSTEVAHEVGGLDGGVGITFAAVGLAGLGAVPKPIGHV